MEKVRKKLIREKAVIAVYQYLLTEATYEDIENYLNAYYKPRMNKDEINLCKELVIDVIEKQDVYNQSIAQNLKKGWTLSRLPLMNHAILLVSLSDLKSTPKEIVVNEAVELAKKYGDEQDYKFINGVLSAIG
ncbi:MAG: transcription antitermination factor NusB [Faecalibacillus sp.]